MNTHTVKHTYQTEGGSVTVGVETVNMDHSINLEPDELNVGATDVQLNVSIDVSELKSFCFACKKAPGEPSDATTILKIETNNAGTPDNTFTITPTNGIVWSLNDIASCPLTVDVTALYLTNMGTGKVLFIGRVGVDSTPVL